MHKKFFLLTGTFLLLSLSFGGCMRPDDQAADNKSGEERGGRATTGVGEKVTAQENTPADNSTAEILNQAVGDIITETEVEQESADREQTDETTTRDDVNELNNLTQTYDEQEF